MICVLSVMNGFGTLVEHMFSEFDPVLLVVPAEGQTLRTDAEQILSLYAREDIEAISMQLEQTALVRYKEHQLPARVMGVDSLFTATAHIDSIITDGFYSVWDGAFERAVLGRGLAAQLGMNAHFTGALHLYAPERIGRINMLRPDQSLRHEHAFIAGTFAVNQIEYDDQLMLVSLPMPTVYWMSASLSCGVTDVMRRGSSKPKYLSTNAVSRLRLPALRAWYWMPSPFWFLR
jgi:ABC-type lipoprotein release transport system permease subunit